MIEDNSVPAVEKVACTTADMLNSLWGRHIPTLRKLMQVKRCKTRSSLFALEIDPEFVKHLLAPQEISHADVQYGWYQIRDADLARQLGITPKRWHYVKRILLASPTKTKRQ